MVRPKRSLGQNFLIDTGIQRRIVDALEAGPETSVLEIGPGTGALTRHLAGEVKELTAIELDDRLAAALAREFQGQENVEILHANALQTELDQVSSDPASLRVIGNIPYNITSPLIFWLLERPVRPELIVLMIQKEVADRIVAEPGSKEYGALSIGVRSVAKVERLFNVGRRAFRPPPSVESTVIRITPIRPAPLTEPEEIDLRTLTRVAFAWRRKQLQKILRSAPEYRLGAEGLERVAEVTGIDLRLRPEMVAPEGFIELSRALRAEGVPQATQKGDGS